MLRGKVEIGTFDTGTKVIDVYEEADIGLPDGNDEIQMGDYTTYVIREPITTTNIWVPGIATEIWDFSRGNNALTFNGTAAFKSTNLVQFIITKATISGSATTNFIDLTSTGSPGFFSLDEVFLLGFNKLGTTTNVSHAYMRMSVFNFLDGFTFNGGGLAALDFGTYVTAANATIFELTGTWPGTISFPTNDLETGAGGHAFKIDNAVDTPLIRVMAHGYTGGTFYDPAGLDQTDPKVRGFLVEDVADSNVTGVMSFSGNITATEFSGTDTYTDILGTTTPGSGNERVTHSTPPNRLTYVGLEPIVMQVHVIASVTKSGGAVDAFVAICKNGTPVADAESPLEITNKEKGVPVQFPVPLTTGDTVSAAIKNMTNTDDILVAGLVVTAHQ